MNVLFILAHNDDEYFCALRMHEEIRLGNRVIIAYLTYGGRQGEDPDERIKESLRVLSASGVKQSDILSIGRSRQIPDLKLHERTIDAYQELDDLLKDTSIQRVYLMAWEGGHPDHDASHMVGVAFARNRDLLLQAYEFPAYSRLHVMHPLRSSSRLLATRTDRMHALKTLISGFSYTTQRRTFMAMLPGSIAQLLIIGHQNYWLLPSERDYSKPPHAGGLFYEKRFHISFGEFSRNTGTLASLMRGKA